MMGGGTSKTTAAKEKCIPNKKEFVQTTRGHQEQGSLELKLLQTSTNEELSVKKPPAGVKKFTIGDRVHLRGYVGNIKFVGATELGQGDWIGIEMEKELSQGHNGSYEGIQYFFCKAKHGVFARSSLVFPFDESDQNIIENPLQIAPRIVVFIQTNIRRYIAKIRKKKLELSSDIDKDIDKHVRSTPETETISINRLSHYLTEPWDGNQRSRAFALYRWITLNIAFDSDGYFGKEDKKNCDAESVLENRLAVSAGYSNLFESLCNAANIQVRSVCGYAKGYGQTPGHKFLDGQGNHSWNIIRVGGSWLICDATWGAGHCGEDMMFNTMPNIHYFMMEPERAITDHYPFEEKWQLTNETITKEEFEKLAVPSTTLYGKGVRLESHKECSYIIDSDHISMYFHSTRKNILKGFLKDSSGRILIQRNMVQTIPHGEDQIKVSTYFPEAGKYKLQVYILSSDQWVNGVEYEIIATDGVGQNVGGFPSIGSHFHSLGFELDKPLENIETENGKAFLSLLCYNEKFLHLKCKLSKLFLSSDNNELSEEVQDNSMCFSEKVGESFKLKVHLPQLGTYKLDLHGKKFNEDSQYLCTYFINSYSGSGQVPGFPQLSEKFKSLGLKLVDKFENIGSHDGTASITLRAPKGIFITGYLKCGEEDYPNMCYTESKDEAKGESTVHINTPKPGIFRVNIFGRKGVDGKSQFLCSYVVKSSKGAGHNPGFPRISDLFESWSLELVDQFRNIISKDGKTAVTLKTPDDVQIEGHLNENGAKEIKGMCMTKNAENGKQILVHTPTPGFFTLNIFGRRRENSKKQFLCSYTIKSLRTSSENPGFSQLADKFYTWGLELIDQFENISTDTGRATFRLKTPGSTLVRACLKQNEEDLGNDLCFSERNGNESRISCHLPEAGIYRLNMYGREGADSEPLYLGCFSVLSTRGLGERAGFPYLSNDFRTWGLRLESHRENISVYDGSVVLTFLNPNEIDLDAVLVQNEARQAESCLKQESMDERIIFHCKLPRKGKYCFRLSGSNVAGSQTKQLLCSYKIFY